MKNTSIEDIDDSDIDFSDIPEIKHPVKVRRNPYYDRIMKHGMTIREYDGDTIIREIKLAPHELHKLSEMAAEDMALIAAEEHTVCAVGNA